MQIEDQKQQIDIFLNKSGEKIKFISSSTKDDLIDVLDLEKYDVPQVIKDIISSEIYGPEWRQELFDFDREFVYYLKHSISLSIEEKRNLLEKYKSLPANHGYLILELLKNEMYALYGFMLFNILISKRLTTKKYNMLLNYV